MTNYLCSHLVKLRWADHEAGANLESISSFAVCVNSEEPIEPGVPIVIDTHGSELRGVVQACESDRAGIFIDIQLDSEWTPALFTPDHLTDPSLAISTERSATARS
jgi:hypothetical protein